VRWKMLMPTTDVALPAPSTVRAMPAWRQNLHLRRPLAVASILLVLLILWSIVATIVEAPAAVAQLSGHGGNPDLTAILARSWSITRPLLPSPLQLTEELWKDLLDYPITSPRSLVYHAAVTLEVAVAGFVLGAAIGIGLAIAVMQSALLRRGLQPWLIAWQCVPVIATAPMIAVLIGNLGFGGFVPKTVIAASVCFFPITINMVRGLQSPETIQFELMQIYSASPIQIFRKLRWPASLTYLFPGLKVGMALAITGAIVAELPTGAQAGLGARLLVASYAGYMMLMWATLVVACVTAGLAVGVIGIVEHMALRRRQQ
jgi:NitT/TauT family transport system permease protein